MLHSQQLAGHQRWKQADVLNVCLREVLNGCAHCKLVNNLSDKNSSVSADAYAVLAAVEVGKTAHSHITLHMQSSRRTQDMPRPF